MAQMRQNGQGRGQADLMQERKGEEDQRHKCAWARWAAKWTSGTNVASDTYGAVKITPSHDTNDYELGRRHGLPSISVIDDNGCMVHVPEHFQGMKRFDARRAVVDALRDKGLLRDMQDHAMTLPMCSRSGDVVEPMLKEQWFLNCSQMAQQASQVVLSGELELIPDIYDKIWHAWLNNIRDWCISRQLWWGHQIPAYKATSATSQEEMWVSAHSEEAARSKASSQLRCPASDIHLHRDPDVLDTWFSAALFPFSSLGWPNMRGDYKDFYPTSLLETAGDILFFWVARMVMLGQHLTGHLPFKQVLLHGLLRDSHGRKMSKSLGNVIDPMDVISGISLKDLQRQVEQSNLSSTEIQKAQHGQKKDFPLGIEECGADSLRYALCSYQYKAHVLNVDVSHIKSYRNFCNKIWQAFRFCQTHWSQELYPPLTEQQVSRGSATDRWILSRLSQLVETCDRAFQDYSLNQATQALHHFWVQDFCDVYVEYAKSVFLRDDPECRALVESILYQCAWTMLRCVSPFMPYLSEELYQRLPGPRAASVCVAEYPRPADYPWHAEHAEQDMMCVREIISELLALRKDLNLTKEKPKVWLESTDDFEYESLLDHLQALTVLSRSSEVHVTMETNESDSTADLLNKDNCIEIDVSDTCRAYLELEGVLDVEQTLKVLDKQLAALEAEHEELQEEARIEEGEPSPDKDGHS